MAANLQLPFADVVLNQGDIITGTVGGPEFSTDTTINHGGYEQRNANWMIPLGRWEIGQRGYCQSTKDYLLSFFRQRRGRFQGFLWRDLADFQATSLPVQSELGFTTQGLIVYVSPGVGQLVKRYSDGMFSADRPIYKPEAFTVTIPAGLSLLAQGVVTGAINLGDELPCTFNFFTPVRFDTDSLRMSLRATEGRPADPDYEAIFDVESLPIVELRRL